MRTVIIFGAGAFCGSLITYFLMRRRKQEEAEYIENEVEKKEEHEELPPKEVVAVERKDYLNLVTELYSPKPVSKEDAPYLITEDQYYESNPDYAKTTLTYFAGDGTLEDTECDAIVDDLDYCIGLNNLYYLGTNDLPDPNVMYIRNDAAGTDYRVEMVEGCYQDGYSPYEDDE